MILLYSYPIQSYLSLSLIPHPSPLPSPAKPPALVQALPSLPSQVLALALP
jgi:hypothetical protein